ncbi:MAG: serine/threonine protein kinase [Myxococcales bacterium]|nr:serine/threonine protein kinase [Myxococcales bacterium]
MPNPQPGTILGAYRVEGTIGAGSMGEVFKGIDTGLNRRVAIKILSEKHKDSPELRARFVREGRAVAAISHPNVVQVFATGQFDERPYIAMELLDGTDLGSIVENNGPLDSLSAALNVLDAAQGLAAASRAGLIHRDVKPSNLVRLSDGKVKVTDFGLAKPVDPGAEPALTAMGVVVGTPDYIAPEQARGEPIDERVDIYALGGTLYFLLTGIPPFRTGKPAEDKYLKVVARHLRNPPPDASVVKPACDRELAELARTMMAKKSVERPSYDELVHQLSGIVARLDPTAVPMLMSSSRDRSRPFSVPPENQRSDESATVSDGGLAPGTVPRAFPGWLVLITLLSIAVFVAGLVVYLRKGDTPAQGASPGAGTSPPAKDASVGANVGAAASEAPAGMRLVRKPDGSPWFYTDAQPVSVAAYRQVFSKHEQAGKPEDPVVNLSYTEAKSFALTRGARLLTSAEWDAAVVTPNVAVVPGLFEWVDSPDEKKRIVRHHGKTLTRPDQKQKDVTFRTARNP